MYLMFEPVNKVYDCVFSISTGMQPERNCKLTMISCLLGVSLFVVQWRDSFKLTL